MSFLGSPNDPGLPAQSGPFLTPILAHAPHGIALNADGVLDGNLDASGSLYRIGMGVTCLNGVNSSRGGVPNSITVEAADGAGATFFVPIYLNNTTATEGSLNNIWSQINLNEPTDVASPAYAEGVAFFAAVNANRQGALAEGIEADVTVGTGKQSRTNAGTFAVSDPNTVASYAAVVGANSEYSVTGSRVINLVGSGAAGPGVGAYIHGAFQTAAVATSMSSPSTVPSLAIYSGSPNSVTNTTPFFQATSSTLSWGPGGVGALDTNLYRGGASTLQTDSNFTIQGTGKLTLGALGQAIVSSGYFDITRTAAGSGMIRTFVTADANPRWQVTADGSQSWGPGSAAADITLARTGATTLGITSTAPTCEVVSTSLNATFRVRTPSWGTFQVQASASSPGDVTVGSTNATAMRLGTSGPVIGLAIDTSQNVIVGPGAKATPAELATTATAGMFYIPTVNGTPTGTPSSLPTGAAPMVIDRTGNKLWFYIGGTWKGVAVA